MRGNALAFWCAILGNVLLLLYNLKVLPLVYVVGSGFLLFLLLVRDVRRSGYLSVGAQLLFTFPFLLYMALSLSPSHLVEHLLGFAMVMAAAKGLGERKARDVLQLFALAQLSLVATATMRIDLSFALVFCTEAFLFITGLFFIHASTQSRFLTLSEIKSLFVLGVVSTLIVFVLTVIFFVVLPRPKYSFLSAPWGRKARTGLSSKVRPGEFDSIKESDSVAYRIRVLNGKFPSSRYFRVYVYGRYMAGVWSAVPVKRENPSCSKGEEVVYEVVPSVPEPVLPALGCPVDVVTLKGPKAYVAEEHLLRLRRVPDGPSLYRVRSVLSAEMGAKIPPSYFLEVPEYLKDRLLRIALPLRKATDFDTALSIEAFLKRNFRYTLKPGRPKGEPVLWFLERGKRGNCEYFASSMVLLLRVLGIPARMVGGYAHGTWNPVGNYLILRDSDAHAWVQVWIEGRGWVRFDPTPSAVKRKVHRGLLWRLSLWWDYLQWKWYYWVIDYNLDKQLRIFKGLTRALENMKPVDVKGLRVKPATLLWLPFAVLPLGIVIMLKRRRKLPHEILLEAFQRRFDLQRGESETLREFIERVRSSFPELEEELSEFLDLYHQFRFGGKDTLKRQKELVSFILSRMRGRGI